MMDKKNKLIRLKNNEEYIILEQCSYNDEIYYIAAESKEKKQTGNLKVLTIKIKNEKQIVKKIENDDIIKKVFEELERKIDRGDNNEQ